MKESLWVKRAAGTEVNWRHAFDDNCVDIFGASPRKASSAQTMGRPRTAARVFQRAMASRSAA
jgi:hypothetical protein